MLRKTQMVLLLFALQLPFTFARAEVVFEILGEGAATGMSADGTVITGLMAGDMRTPFCWTSSTGVVSLGQPPSGFGGIVSISADGSCIAAKISDATNTFTTWGLWKDATGWQELIPPAPNGSRIR